jgi:POT family proton-dependent oligopeptide transporter
MALFLLSTSVGNLFTAIVNDVMVEPLQASAVETGAQTWVSLVDAGEMAVGQKIDFGGDSGVTVSIDGKSHPLAGTFMVAEVDANGSRVRLMDAIHRQPLVSEGQFNADAAQVSTYALVGPMYFLFFAAVMTGGALLFIFVALFYRERTFVRDAAASDSEALAEEH